jgi:hypothetical protein
MGDDSNPLEQDIRLVAALKFVNIDKDNMEFRVTFTCFQREALQRVIEAAGKYNDLATS